jgi:transposase
MEVSMSNRRYSEEFKAEAVRQVRERGYPVQEVAGRIGVSAKSLYGWVRGARGDKATGALDTVRRENARLKAELKRVEEERDILKKAAAYFAKASR